MKSLFAVLCVIAAIGFACADQIQLNETECVERHDYYRKMHQAPNITWSDDLERDAQAWADHLASTDTFAHAIGTGQGENLYKSSGDSEESCRKATKAFYDEEPLYNYEAGNYVKGAGHFTQVVWVASINLGVGKAKTANGAIILVFRYKPAGNVIGAFKKNVLPKPGGGAFSALHTSPYLTLALSLFSVFTAQYFF